MGCHTKRSNDLGLGSLAFGGQPWQADDGSMYPPIPWGSESNAWKGMAGKYPGCPGCGASKGQFHMAGCSVEQIPAPLLPGMEPRPIAATTAVVERRPQTQWVRPAVRWLAARWYRTLLVLWLLTALARGHL